LLVLKREDKNTFNREEKIALCNISQKSINGKGIIKIRESKK
jgi:hypothetical protein